MIRFRISCRGIGGSDISLSCWGGGDSVDDDMKTTINSGFSTVEAIVVAFFVSSTKAMSYTKGEAPPPCSPSIKIDEHGENVLILRCKVRKTEFQRKIIFFDWPI